MAVNLKSLSPTELQALINKAQAQMEDARKNLVADVRAKIDAILNGAGLTLDDVYHRRGVKHTKGGKSTLKGSKVAPKYRNPENPSETWTGRGRSPAWFTAALKKRGVTKETLLVGGAGAATKKASKKVAKKTAKKAVKKAVRRKAKA